MNFVSVSRRLQLFLSSLRSDVEDTAAEPVEAARRSFDHAVVVLLAYLLLLCRSSFLPSFCHCGGYQAFLRWLRAWCAVEKVRVDRSPIK
jgi:hypothetical protein